MKILLVYPKYPDTFWSFKYALKFISKKASLPPLGLLTVAAMLPAKWEQRLVDMNVQHLTDADLRWADYVMLSAMTIQKESANSVITSSSSYQHTADNIQGIPLSSGRWTDAFP